MTFLLTLALRQETASLIRSLDPARPKDYWAAIETLSTRADDDSIRLVRDAVLKGKSDLFLALQGNPEATGAILDVLERGSNELRLRAVDALGRRRAAEAIGPMVERLGDKKIDADVRDALIDGLQRLTGHSHRTAVDWRAWWEASGGSTELAPAPSGDGLTTVVRPTGFEDLRRGDRADIIVVSGKFDSVQDVLRALKIPYTQISKRTLDDGHDIARAKAVLINCDEYKDFRLSRETCRRLRDYVDAGGYLWTSDWALVDVHELAFPGVLRRLENLSQDNVEVYPATGASGHRYLRDVFVRAEGVDTTTLSVKIDHRWEIDDVSFLFEPADPKVEVLVTSPELGGPVAVTWGGGEAPKAETGGGVKIGANKRNSATTQVVSKQGRVLHVLSHFGKQRRESDEYALQNMMLNFLMEANRRTQK